MVLIVMVDYLIFSSNSKSLLEHFKTEFPKHFDMKMFGELKPFLGWEIRCSDRFTAVTQRRYVDEMLRKHGLDEGNSTLTSIPSSADL